MSPVSILQWLRDLIACPELTPAEVKIGSAIALRINSDSGICWPSLETLAQDSRLSVSVAARAVAKLAKLGLIVIRHTGRSNRYGQAAVEQVIDTTVAEWKNDPKLARHLTPQTILKPARIEATIAAPPAPKVSRAACHQPFERTEEPQGTLEAAKAGLAKVREILKRASEPKEAGST